MATMTFKYGLDDEVYFLAEQALPQKCAVCNNRGLITVKETNKELICPGCQGDPHFVAGKTLMVCKGMVVGVSAIKYPMSGTQERQLITRYRVFMYPVQPGTEGSPLWFAEHDLFSSEAVAKALLPKARAKAKKGK